jgi:hypothetical protein
MKVMLNVSKHNHMKDIFLFLIVMISFDIYGMEEVPEVPEEHKNVVEVIFPGEQERPGHSPRLKIDTDQMPFFRGFERLEGVKVITLKPQKEGERLSPDALKLIKKMDKVMQSNEGREIAESFKYGTYKIPEKDLIMFSEDQLSLGELQTILNTASFVNFTGNASLLLYEYARRLLHSPIPATSDFDINQVTLERTYDLQLAKIIIDHALLKTAQYTTTPISIKDQDAPGPYLNYGAKRVEATSSFYLRPTVTADRCCLIETSLDRYKSWINQKKKGPDGMYGGNPLYAPETERDFKVPVGDTSSDGNYVADIGIANLQESRLVVSDTDGIKWDILIGTEVDAENAKIIFEPNNHSFFLKCNDKVYQCDADANLSSLNEPIPLNAIHDPWIKKYLTDDTASAHTCAGVLYGADTTRSYFNTGCLHATEFVNRQKEALERQLSYIYYNRLAENIHIIQCACDHESDSHYYLSKVDAKSNNTSLYNLTNVTFKPDTRMQKLLNFMNNKAQDQSFFAYPNAMFIYHASTNNWLLTPAQLSKKMGVLDQCVSSEVKKIVGYPGVFTQIKHYLQRTVHHIMPYIPYFSLLGGLGYIILRDPKSTSELEKQAFSLLMATSVLSLLAGQRTFLRPNIVKNWWGSHK